MTTVIDYCMDEGGCYAEAGPSGLCPEHHAEAWPPIPMRAYDDWCRARGILTHDERLAVKAVQRGAVLVVKP
jgi:hypothetical protein